MLPTVKHERSDVLVVGGGPAGTSVAWALAREGVDVAVIDRARFPRDKPCGEYLSPEASRILADMGALAPCEAAGAAQLAGMMIRAPGGALIHGDFSAAHGFHGFRDRGLALRRTVLDAILLDRARAGGARVMEGARATGLMRDEGGRVVGVSTSENGVALERRATVVIGADGLRSLVARRLGLSRHSRLVTRYALVAHYRGIAGVGSHGEMHVHRDGYVGLADVGLGVTNVALVVPRLHARRAAGDPGRYLDEWVRRRPQLAARFLDAERDGAVLATGPFASRARRAWAAGAALVGDAADFFDPFTGEGIYAALRGGELLAPAVAEAVRARSPRAADRALADYDRRRRREFGGKWRVERMIGLAVGWPALMNRAAATLERRKDMADLLVGIAGDFVPAGEVLSARFLLSLVVPAAPPPARARIAPAPRHR
ncbi:MAG: NAD(P)/FAD-dependent oxidoreductase [Gemmatimonadota bacterium]|nr:NAD(P)/FAD-dependent oxidoreductase [Gemmatimonadota bacterium]